MSGSLSKLAFLTQLSNHYRQSQSATVASILEISMQNFKRQPLLVNRLQNVVLPSGLTRSVGDRAPRLT